MAAGPIPQHPPFQNPNTFLGEPTTPATPFRTPRAGGRGSEPAGSPNHSVALVSHIILMLCWHGLLEGRALWVVTLCPSTNEGWHGTGAPEVFVEKATE